jgi:DNA repair photolyase
MFQQATLPLLFVLSPALQPDPGAAFARRLRKAALRREPIVVGSAASPYEPAAGRVEENPLRRVLLREEGLEIAITTGTPRILRELDLLAELDRRHSVAVRMVVPATGAHDPEPRLRAVRGLTAEGIATSVLLSPLPPGSRSREEILRFLLEEALEAGALDVEIDARSLRRGERDHLVSLFWRLRLEYGFPRRASGRG